MIHIITTGGTIEGLDYETKGCLHKNANIKIQEFFKIANTTFKFSLENALSKDSRFITIEDRQIVAQKIDSVINEKILITHGTITMVETARYLGELNLNKTIVLVGSFVLGHRRNTDAPFNLGYAICAVQTLPYGVYVAMNGEIFIWDNVKKNIKENRFEMNAD